MENNETTEVLTQFVERLAICGEQDGLPRIAGRLIGFLMVHEGAYSLDDLAESLQASKASVSTNARLLEERGLIVRTSHPGDRRDFYEVAPSPWEWLIADSQRRVLRLATLVEDTIRTLPGDAVVARRRLTEAALFYRFLHDRMEETQVKWQEVLKDAEQNGLLEEPPLAARE